jgi:RNA polymerase sigma-70 factor (ECF subfamily)
MSSIEMSLNYFSLPFLKKKTLKKESEMSSTSFQQLIIPFEEKLYNFIFKALNFSQDADDVFQETVLRAFKYRNSFKIRAFKYRNSFKTKGSFRTWLFSIASNEIRSYFNKNKNLIGKCNSLDCENIVCDVDNKTRVQDVYDVAESLDPKKRQVFFLFYYNRFSINEIKEITGIKEGNIKFILNQCRGEIKSKLEDK